MMRDNDDKFFTFAFWPLPFGVIGAIGWVWGVAAYPPLEETELNTLAFGLGVLLAAAYVGFAATRMRGEGKWVARLGVVAAMAALGWIGLFVGTLPVVNGLLGGKAEEKHYAKVLEVRHTVGKPPDLTKSVVRSIQKERLVVAGGEPERWELLVASWLPGRANHLFEVRKAELEAVQMGKATHMLIVTRNGFLGYPWMVSAKVAEGYTPPRGTP